MTHNRTTIVAKLTHKRSSIVTKVAAATLLCSGGAFAQEPTEAQDVPAAVVEVAPAAGPSPSPTAPAQGPVDAAKATTTDKRADEVAVPTQAAAPMSAVPAKTTIVVPAPTEVQASGGVGAAPQAPPQPVPQEPPRINPLAETDEHNLGKHASDPDASYYKPGTGLVFTSKDGDFSLAPRLRIQFRNELETEGDETTNVFGIRRARLQFKGHVFGKNNKLKAEFAFSPRDLSLRDGVPNRTPLLSWFTEHTQLRDLSLRIGQYKLLYSRQRVVSSGDQEFVDRTIAQGEFNLDRDIGFHFFSKDLFGLDRLKYYAGVTIAEGRDVWESEVNGGDAEASWQYLARFEYLPFGDFKDYSEVDFKRLNNLRLSIGAAYAYSKNASRNRGYLGDTFTDGGTADFNNVTADVLAKWAGWTAFAEYYYRNGERTLDADDLSNATDDDVLLPRNGSGGSFQLGYLLPGLPIGLGARYSAFGRGSFSADETSVVDRREAGGTVGWYIAGHPLKLQADYFHIWSREAETSANRFRVQLQVAY